MPAGVGRPAAAAADDPRRLDHHRPSPDQREHSAGTCHGSRGNDHPDDHERRAHRGPQHHERGTPPWDDPPAQHGRQEMEQRREDHQRDEPEDVGPGVGRPEPRPGLQHRPPARDHQRRERPADRDVDESQRVAKRNHGPAHHQPSPSGRVHSRGHRTDPDEIRGAAHDRRPAHGRVDPADRHERRARPHQHHGRPAQTRSRGRSCGERGHEEWHHARDRRRSATGQGQVERQPRRQHRDAHGRSERRQGRRDQEDSRGRDGEHRDPPVIRAPRPGGVERPAGRSGRRGRKGYRKRGPGRWLPGRDSFQTSVGGGVTANGGRPAPIVGVTGHLHKYIVSC